MEIDEVSSLAALGEVIGFDEGVEGFEIFEMDKLCKFAEGVELGTLPGRDDGVDLFELKEMDEFSGVGTLVEIDEVSSLAALDEVIGFDESFEGVEPDKLFELCEGDVCLKLCEYGSFDGIDKGDKRVESFEVFEPYKLAALDEVIGFDESFEICEPDKLFELPEPVEVSSVCVCESR